MENNLSQDSLDVLYATAYEHITTGKFQEGEKLLYSLVLLEPESTKYWKALAFAQQKQGIYQEACATYSIVSSLKPDDPEPYLRAAECFFSMGERDSGFKGLHEAEKRIQHSPALAGELALLKNVWSTVNK